MSCAPAVASVTVCPVRACLVLAVAAMLLALPAGAATPHPRTLVLAQADVPAGFRLDRERTGIRTNASEIKDHPELAPLFRRSQRLTGYEIEFVRGESKIGSRVDVLRTRAGAEVILDWYAREVQKAGLRGLRRSRAAIGDRGWLYVVSPQPAPVTFVVWRYENVFAGVLGDGITVEQTRGLARAQQRRIVLALG